MINWLPNAGVRRLLTRFLAQRAEQWQNLLINAAILWIAPYTFLELAGDVWERRSHSNTK